MNTRAGVKFANAAIASGCMKEGAVARELTCAMSAWRTSGSAIAIAATIAIDEIVNICER